MPAAVNDRSGWNAAVDALEEMAKAMGEKADAARSPNPFDPATMEEADAATSGWVLEQAARLLRERTPAFSPAPDAREVKREAPSWRIIRSATFGEFVNFDMPKCADMIAVCVDTVQHIPVSICLPHQLYVRNVLALAEQHGCKTLTIIPYRNSDKVEIKVDEVLALSTVEQEATSAGSRKSAPIPEDDGDALSCFVCNVPFKADDICADDINEGSAHAACLEGSAIVDLETGEPSEGPIATWRYGDRA